MSAVRTYVLAKFPRTKSVRWERLYHPKGGPLPTNAILRFGSSALDAYVRTVWVEGGRANFTLLGIVRKTLGNRGWNQRWDRFATTPDDMLDHVRADKELRNKEETEDVPRKLHEVADCAGDRWVGIKDLHLIQKGNWFENPTPITSEYEYISYTHQDPRVTLEFSEHFFLAKIPIQLTDYEKAIEEEDEEEEDFSEFDAQIIALHPLLVQLGKNTRRICE